MYEISTHGMAGEEQQNKRQFVIKITDNAGIASPPCPWELSGRS